MLFERQVGKLLFRPIEKLLDQPIKNTKLISVYACYLITFLANSSMPHNGFLKNIKEYFAGWKLFITTWDSYFVNSIFYICFILLTIKIIFLFQRKGSESFDWSLYGWVNIYLHTSMFYTSILVLIEPSFASFFRHFNEDYYGSTEIFSIFIGLACAIGYFIIMLVKLLQEEGLLMKL